jgi:hypothetical protein
MKLFVYILNYLKKFRETISQKLNNYTKRKFTKIKQLYTTTLESQVPSRLNI